MADYSQSSPYFNTGIFENYLDVLSFREIAKEPALRAPGPDRSPPACPCGANTGR